MSTSAPTVSVIVATYNSSATLRCALRSLLAQDLRDFEAWIVGDGCTEESEAVVAELADARLHWLNLAENGGNQWRPNNEGLRRARGRYVAYLGHDDLWLPSHLSALVAHAEKTGAGFVHDLCVNLGPAGVLDVNGPPADGATYERHGFPPSSWLHRRDLVDTVGCWADPAALSWHTDYDFTRRVWLAGTRIEFVPSLGVVKFPAPRWKTYARGATLPQTSHLEAMLAAPEEFKARMLADIAVAASRFTRQGAKQPLALALREAGAALTNAQKVLVRAALETYGRDRWPLRPFLRARMQRILKRGRAVRGLPPEG
ncbi:MAG: glycosyltransferase family 2 protein [Verrucomicrobia bacterium]|nr:glycosyltransferase family 2 protein [Verrucomicrobiota bacterium]